MRKIISPKFIIIMWAIKVEVEVMWLVIKVGRSLGGTTKTKSTILIKTRNKD